MMPLSGKHIVLGITGGIAAYKTPDLVRKLIEQGASVRVVLTDNATQFVTPLTLQTVSGNRVYTSLWNEQNAMEHIELARWADLLLVAPATAQTLAKCAYGLADDLLSNLFLTVQSPIIMAPAMNKNMWLAPATQTNKALLSERGVVFLGPDEGNQACGDVGPGRMMEPAELVDGLNTHFGVTERHHAPRVLITAGPTIEAIDPVRFISNHSSGKMGFALAEAFSRARYAVTLISGPVNLDTPADITRINVKSAAEMLEQVQQQVIDHDIFISTAAVSDYRVKTANSQKLKKTHENLQLDLVRNPDILREVGALEHPPFIVGFAAETNDVIPYAKRKLHEKSLDMIVANQVSETKGFHSDYNEVSILCEDEQRHLPYATKQQIAKELTSIILERYTKRHEKHST